MNALALQLPCKSANVEKSVRLNFFLGQESINTVTSLLEDHGYFVSLELNFPQKEDHYCLLIDTEIDPHWIPPFSRWLLKKANLKSLQTSLEDSEGNIIAQCSLYGTGTAL